MSCVKICVICQTSFVAKRKDSSCCNETCLLKYTNIKSRNLYNKSLKSKFCTLCKESFKGKRQECLCEKCKGSNQEREYIKINQSICCRQCNKVVSVIIKNKTKVTKENLFEITCNDCKLIIYNNSSKRMKESNPMFNVETKVKVAETQKKLYENNSEVKERLQTAQKNSVLARQLNPIILKEEVKLAASLRMKENNPMFNMETRIKVVETKRQSGQFDNYPKGYKHHLWKGNRDKHQIIRSRLYTCWIKPILIRDKFTCCLCSTTNCRLEVHHNSETFKDIITKFLNNSNINELNEIEFENLCLNVVNYHASVSGITVCVPCHKIIDNQRR